MNKDELIERLAQSFYYADNSGDVPDWDQLEDDDLEVMDWQLEAERHLPVIVAFVAEWLEEKGAEYMEPFAEELIVEWREAMG